MPFFEEGGVFLFATHSVHTSRLVGTCDLVCHTLCKNKAKKKCVFSVRWPGRPYIFHDTFSRKLLKYPIFAFQCSFWCPREDYFDKKQQQPKPHKCHSWSVEMHSRCHLTSIQIKNLNYFQPTDPNFFQHVTRNTHNVTYFLFGLTKEHFASETSNLVERYSPGWVDDHY